jgi:hypothetical protein
VIKSGDTKGIEAGAEILLGIIAGVDPPDSFSEGAASIEATALGDAVKCTLDLMRPLAIRSKGLYSHMYPDFWHLMQEGRPSSHLTRRILTGINIYTAYT